MITRAEVMHRAGTVWPPGSVVYSQSTLHPGDGYRQDCSGYVSMCWRLPLTAPGSWGGQSTVTLVTLGHMVEIPPDQLKTADAIGLCGPGTAGNAGHVQLFDRWLNNDPDDSRYYCWQQGGGRRGPTHDLEDWPANYKAYRYVGIIEEDEDMSAQDKARLYNAEQIAWALAEGKRETTIVATWEDPDHGGHVGVPGVDDYPLSLEAHYANGGELVPHTHDVSLSVSVTGTGSGKATTGPAKP